jgi:hypothetical protein
MTQNGSFTALWRGILTPLVRVLDRVTQRML